MNLMQASNQWSVRPDDERFGTLEELYSVTRHYADISVQAEMRPDALKVEAGADNMLLVGETGTKAVLTNYAFGQIAARAGAPAGYLRTLPADLAATCINTTLPERQKDAENAVVLFHSNGGLITRCITSDRYSRIWNHEITAELMKLEGWKIPPARKAREGQKCARIATAEDCLSQSAGHGLSIKPGDIIAPAGLYASDRDMFAFMVDDDHSIINPLDRGRPLARGFFCWNSEVGDKTFGLMAFLYDAVCGNHIVWGAQDVREIKVRHVGEARSRAFQGVEVSLRRYAESSADETEAKISASQTMVLGRTMQETVSALLAYVGKKRIQLNEGTISEAYQLASETERYGNPNTPWGVVQGLTELSQRYAYADKRNAIDRAAGQLLTIAF